MELKKINANIALVAKTGARFNELVQATAVGILVHCFGEGDVKGSGDCTAALRLVQAMPKSARRGLLINFFAKHSPIGMNVGTGKVGLHKPAAKAYNAPNIAGARADPWYNSVEANDENLPDTTLEQANKMIFAVASKLQKALDDGRVPANDLAVITAQVSALKELGKTVALAA